MTNNTSLERRQFLSKITAVVSGSATLAATAPLISATPVVRESETKQQDIPASKGYQRTQHVDTYYQLADF